MSKKGKRENHDVKTMSKLAHAAREVEMPKAHDADEYAAKGETFLEKYEYELAQKFCARALEKDADHVRALELMATASLELGDPEAAYKCLVRAVELEPDVGHSKYMYLAQLLDGFDGVAAFSKGIELLKKQRELVVEDVLDGDVAAINTAIATAYCSMAELYMTDLCMEENAESKCRSCLEAAIAADANNVEALQTMASFMLSTQQPEMALQTLQRSLALWGEDPSLALPYESRINTVRLLIELEQHVQAINVLDQLHKEDDEVVEVWYLFGWVAHLTKEHEVAANYLRKAMQLFEALECDDTAMRGHMQELLGEYAAQGIVPATEEDLEADADEEWDDISDDDAGGGDNMHTD